MTKGAAVNATIAESTEDQNTTGAIAEALAIVDKALAEMLRRELVSSGEVADLLLDLRSILSAAGKPAATSAVS
ncbi:MAG: hypothetical protein EBU67_00150 [Actinobacteria bacterium]|jgi:hypothetical protein|nr:hypothetical protein [Actinomycetota bacterium]NBP52709.1 hypothetical protein [Actinomycetota bacterium]